jgi:hypothetical protein
MGCSRLNFALFVIPHGLLPATPHSDFLLEQFPRSAYPSSMIENFIALQSIMSQVTECDVRWCCNFQLDVVIVDPLVEVACQSMTS